MGSRTEVSNHLPSDSQSNTPAPSTARVIAVASGKGGVGKTNLVTNLAIAVAARGHRVCIVDADPGMANVNILLGFSPRHSLTEALNGEAGMSDVLFRGPHGVHVLAGASGMADMVRLNARQRHRLVALLDKLERVFDIILVDLAAGADPTVIDLMRAAHHRMVVVTPDPTSLTNAYSLLKILESARAGLGLGVEVVVNVAADADNGEATFQRLKKVCDLFLRNSITYLGYICADPTISTSVRLRRPVVLLKHDAPASRCFYRLAQALVNLTAQPLPDAQRFSAQWDIPAEPEPRPGVGSSAALQAMEERETAEQLLADTPEPEPEPVTPPAPAAPQPTARATPQPPQAAAAPDPMAVLEQLAARMSSGAMNEHEAGMIVLSLLSACLNGYGRYPIDIRALVNAAINRRELSAEALRHLASQLQQTYRNRFGHELYPVDNPASRQATNS